MLYDKFELTEVRLPFRFIRITELFKSVVKTRIMRQSHAVKPAHRHVTYTDQHSRSSMCRASSVLTSLPDLALSALNSPLL